jgi:S1-C subfamily serine protease
MIKYLLLSFLVFLTACSAPKDPVEERILETKDAVIRIINKDDSCSGFHIGQGFFISAAHCIVDPDTIVIIFKEKPYNAKLIAISTDKDLVVLSSIILPTKLKLAAPQELLNPIGKAVLTMGYPSYYFGAFSFEESRIFDYFATSRNQKVLIALAAAYSGQSGGPLISIETGRVLGVINSASERIKIMNDGQKITHVHKSIGMFISIAELKPILKEARIVVR